MLHRAKKSFRGIIARAKRPVFPDLSNGSKPLAVSFKNFASGFQKYVLISARPDSAWKGVWPIATNVGQDAMDAPVSRGERCGRGRRNRAVPIPRRWDQACA